MKNMDVLNSFYKGFVMQDAKPSDYRGIKVDLEDVYYAMTSLLAHPGSLNYYMMKLARKGQREE